MSEFYATTNPDGTIEPHWVEGQREILCSAGLIKQMIDNANRGILMELETHEAIRADRAKLIAIFRKDSECNCELTKRLLGEFAICFIHTFENVIRNTPIGDEEYERAVHPRIGRVLHGEM